MNIGYYSLGVVSTGWLVRCGELMRDCEKLEEVKQVWERIGEDVPDLSAWI